jgi:hypothetical protein
VHLVDESDELLHYRCAGACDFLEHRAEASRAAKQWQLHCSGLVTRRQPTAKYMRIMSEAAHRPLLFICFSTLLFNNCSTLAIPPHRYQLVYAVGDVTVLPSREERVAAVQALLQALNQLVLQAAKKPSSFPDLTAPGVARWGDVNTRCVWRAQANMILVMCASTRAQDAMVAVQSPALHRKLACIAPHGQCS